MMGAIQRIEDLEEEEDSEDMNIKKRRRGRRHTCGKGEIFMSFII